MMFPQSCTTLHLFLLKVCYYKVNSLTKGFSSKIDYLRALEKCCMQCGDNHQPDCPVGMAKVQISCTNDLLTEFYKYK
jgi:hypothetical protein